MGLKITDQIYTNGGATTEAYLNIEKAILTKDGFLAIHINSYLSLADRVTDPSNIVNSKQLYTRVAFTEFGSPSILETLNIYEASYSLLKDKLESNGLTVVDEI
jgi:hypothetical protein